MKLRAFILKVHLYLGLPVGIIIAITCFTGAVLAFEDELEYALSPGLYEVEVGNKRVVLDELKRQAHQYVPDLTLRSITVYSREDRSVEVRTREGKTVFLNPYSGALLGTYTYRESFFYTMFALHRWLLSGDTGKLIVGISTSIFLFILISGVWVWWPKNRRQLKSRLFLKLKKGWKRFNFDLHVSLGIYASVFLFVMAFTGLVWSFDWFHDGVYWITNSEQTSIPAPESDSTVVASAELEKLFERSRVLHPNAPYYRISFPGDNADPYSVSLLPEQAIHPSATSTLYFDQYSGALLSTLHFSDRNLGSRVRRSFYPVHVGTIFGWPTRILAFLACVLGFTFPITGMIIWFNKRSKRWRAWWKTRLRRKERELMPPKEAVHKSVLP